MKLYFKEEYLGDIQDVNKEGAWLYGTFKPIANIEKYKTLLEALTNEVREFEEDQVDSEWLDENNWLRRDAREIANRPWYEDLWEGTKTFAGELTGYYDYIRAKDGVDPVTGAKLTAGQRVAAGAMAAAGFIPIVGWAGRALKGGKGIYSATKAINTADHALDAYKNVRTYTKLEQTEMGI
ncbi:pre-toxin TG domain-containing protein [Niallia taxi]|uniref:pre-toxin TG domain-containing protein n=1 Tax=Niallia taxi TaxID=2499688 RepID=UPI003981C253